MRNLSSTLLTAQKAATGIPYVKVEVVERLGGVTRFNWARLYEGSETDDFHALTIPGDGSLIRLRVFSALLFRQRVTSPDENSDYSQWTFWSTTAHAVALCSCGATVFAFRIDISGNLYRCESSDNGASWGDWIDMGNIGASPDDYRVAACFKDATNAIVIYTNGVTVYRRRWNGTTWEAPAAWSNTLSSVTGLAVTHMGDWNVVVTGVDTDSHPGVWTCVLGDGYSAAPDTWSALAPLTLASSESHLGFHAPFISFPDVFRIFFVETFNETEAYSRPYWSHCLPTADFISNLWKEPVPFNLSSNYGLALADDGSHAWLTRPSGVWRASLTPASVELTNDVVQLRSLSDPFSGGVEITLRNDDGRFNNAGQAGTAYQAIKKGSEILLSFGYKTPAGNETGGLEPISWITSTEYRTGRGVSHLILHALDGWSLLDAWRARRQYTWSSGQRNIFQLLAWIFSRAGLELSAFSTSSAIVNQYPAFTIHPRESGVTSVKRLLEMVPDVVFFVRDCAYLKNPLPGDASQYSYGTDHAIYEGAFIARTEEANRAQVFGAAVFTEDWDWSEIDLVYDRLSQAIDINLDSTTKAHQRGQAILRESAIEGLSGKILVPMNCGQDLFDVIDISSPQAGLAAQKRRVLALTHTWIPSKAQYTLTVALGAP